MNKELIKKLKKENLYSVCNNLQTNDIDLLVEYLDEKDNDIRYNSLLLLEYIIDERNDIYKYWNLLEKKLVDQNSYQRSIGLMLISRLCKWDKDNKMDKTIDLYLSLCNDEKPITIRQCIQSIEYIIPYKSNLLTKIVDKLVNIDLKNIKETMRKVIVIDILNILSLIDKEINDKRIKAYFNDIVDNKLFDDKVKKEISNVLKEIC